MTDVGQYQMLIDCEWIGTLGGETFDSIDPNVGEVWYRVPLLTWRSGRQGGDEFTRGKRR